MTDTLVEHVARAQEAAAAEFHRLQETVPHSVLAFKGEPLPRMRARAAVRATLEWLRDNVSERMREDATDAYLRHCYNDPHADETGIVFRAMLSAALQDMENSDGV